jgi:phosphoribosylglycinamide formyltransferase-1
VSAPSPTAGAPARLRVGVLVSGNGSNLQALIDACADPAFPAELVRVVSDVPDAYALERARKAQIPVSTVRKAEYPVRSDFDRALAAELTRSGVEWVLLAGFMRLLGSPFLETFPGRVVNIHPALLPSFPGLHAVRQALEHGARITGCTVHLVDEGVDTGPILAQAAVAVLPDDTEQSLAARIQRQEHRLYPVVLSWLARGALRRKDQRVAGFGAPESREGALLNPGAQGGPW